MSMNGHTHVCKEQGQGHERQGMQDVYPKGAKVKKSRNTFECKNKERLMGTMEAKILPGIGGKKTDIKAKHFRSQLFNKES